MPARALQELTRIVQHESAETLSVSVRANQVVFAAGGVVLSSRLIDGQFPNYRQLLPDAYEHELRLGRQRDHRGRAPHLAAGAEERAAAAGVHRGRADGVGAHAGRRRGARDDPGAVRRRAAGDRLQPGVPARRPRGASRAATCCCKLISPLRPGLIQAADGSRVPVPPDADPAQRLSARPCSIAIDRHPAPACATSAPTSAADVRLGPGLTVVSGRNGAGKTNLLEALYFACTAARAGRPTSARCVRFGAELTRLELRLRGPLGRHEVTRRLQAGRGEAAAGRRRAGRAADGRRRPGRSSRSSCPTGWSSCSARRRCGARTSTRSSPRCGRRAPADAPRLRAPRSRSATRCWRASAPAAPRAASLPAWDAELARHGVALMADRAEAVDRLRPRFAQHAEGLGLDGDGGAALPAALEGRRPPRRWPPSSPSASTPTSSAASPATGRTATTSRSGARAASCAPTARAASSGSACSRCCSPSARSWPTSAAPRR